MHFIRARVGSSGVPFRPRLLTRVAVVVAVAALAVFGLGSPAAAHVSVNPRTATQGGFAKLTFRVPNEKATASTVKVEIQLPQDAPVASVSTRPVPGWSVEVQHRTLDEPVTAHGAQITEVVDVITWTASPGAEIGPGQFQEFDISAGPLPEVDQMVFKALQHYSDGEVVRWIDEPREGVELEHPAPVLRLTPAEGDETEAAAGDTGGGSGVAIGFGVAGAVLGLAGLALGLLAYRRSAA
ncbi:MAG: YcnI family protein [Micromonosporaceae bacterium]|nr:YcnI family protein [Micromonosporaceae bacterium]